MQFIPEEKISFENYCLIILIYQLVSFHLCKNSYQFHVWHIGCNEELSDEKPLSEIIKTVVRSRGPMTESKQVLQGYKIDVANRRQSFTAIKGHSLLIAMERSGTQAIKVGCRGGGCGMCKVRVVKGSYTSKRMSRAHVSESDEQQGIVLACRIFPATDLIIESDLFENVVAENY